MTTTQDSDSKMTQDDKIIRFGSKCCASCKNEYNINTVSFHEYCKNIPMRLNPYGWCPDVLLHVRRAYRNYWRDVTKLMPEPCSSCSEIYKKEYYRQYDDFMVLKEKHEEFEESLRDD